MERQRSFAQAEYAQKKKTTRRERFLNEMEQVAPWARLVGSIEPHYFKGERGRKPVGIERMLRMYFLRIRLTEHVRIQVSDLAQGAFRDASGGGRKSANEEK